MTPEQQRIAIAEACGLKAGLYAPAGDPRYPDDPGPTFGPSRVAYWRDGELIDAPDYLSDLNAMHEAEKVLTDFQLREYGNQLQEIMRWFIVGYIENDYRDNLAKLAKIARATATQRAEAFLRTIGKWTT